MSSTKVERNAKVAACTGSGSTVFAIASKFWGLKAPAITKLLATVGAKAGGGMAAGVGVVAAAPVAVGAEAYFGYKSIKKLFK